MHHEHHPGCGHHEADHAHHHIQQHIGQLCCAGQCNHIEHQSYVRMHQEQAQQATLEAVNARAELSEPEKSKKKKRRAVRSFSLRPLILSANEAVA